MSQPVPPQISLRAAGTFLVLAGLPLMLAGQGFTASSGMPVKVEIVERCNLTVADLDFGVYSTTTGAPALGQTTIEFQCAPGVLAALSLDGGTAPGSGNTTRRRMSSSSGGGNRLDYDLFQDAGRTIHWGDTPGENTREVLSTGELQAVPIYGAIPAGQRVQEGSYSDLITVQVHF